MGGFAATALFRAIDRLASREPGVDKHYTVTADSSKPSEKSCCNNGLRSWHGSCFLACVRTIHWRLGMKFSTRILAGWVGAVVMVAAANASNVAEIGDPGFEGTDGSAFNAAWTALGSASLTALERSGTYAAMMTNGGSLSQSLGGANFDDLIAGGRYEVIFYASILYGTQNSAVSNYATSLNILSGTPGLSDGVPVYQEIVGEFLADSGGDFDLEFSFSSLIGTNQGQAEFYLDDLSISQCLSNCDSGNRVPEPGTLLLVGAALAAGSMVRRKKTEH